MHRRRFLAHLTGASFCGAAGCARRVGAGKGAPIVVAVSPYVASGPFYLAHEQGYFTRLGLQVEVQRVANSNQAIPLLAGGRVDVALFSISPAQVNAVARGGALRIVAAREIASPDCATLTLCGRRAVFPHGAPDLKRIQGRRVAIYGRGNTAEFSLDAILSTVGLEAAAVQVVSLPSSEAVSALLSGKVDAVLADALAASRVSASAEVVTLTRFGTVCPGFQFSFILFGSRLLEGDLGVGTRFLQAYLRGNREFMAGKTPAFLEQLSRESGVDPESMRVVCRQAIARDGRVKLADLQRFIDWAVGKGYCPHRVESAQMVDSRFLDEALKRGIT